MEKGIPGTYKVGGRRVEKPTGLPSDSSLGINKAPGKVVLLPGSADRHNQYSRFAGFAPWAIVWIVADTVLAPNPVVRQAHHEGVWAVAPKSATSARSGRDASVALMVSLSNHGRLD